MILILTQCFPSSIGGIESLVSNLSLSLSKNENVIVLADSNHANLDLNFDNNNYIKDRLEIRRFRGFKFFRRRNKLKEIKYLQKTKKIKLIIADSWKSLELGIDYLNLKKIPTICLAHGNELLFDKESKFNRIAKTLNKVSRIVANSNFTHNLIKKIINHETKVDIIYPGAADLRDIEEQIVPNVQGNPIILTLSRIEKRKGHEAVIEIISKLITPFPDIQYVIAGVGPEYVKLKKIVDKKKLEKNIIFTGKVNDGEKKYLFKKSKLMIMTTKDESSKSSIEGFGIVYLEAAYFSIPSIASNIGGTPEAVIHNKTGKIIEEGDDLYLTMYNLLISDDKINILGLNAKKRAIEEFNWDYVIQKYTKLIKTLIV